MSEPNFYHRLIEAMFWVEPVDPLAGCWWCEEAFNTGDGGWFGVADDSEFFAHAHCLAGIKQRADAVDVVIRVTAAERGKADPEDVDRLLAALRSELGLDHQEAGT